MEGVKALSLDIKSTEKVIYLTFDCGYEYENLTSVNLDTLADKQVTAAFFCTLDYLEDAPEIAARMINEGHTVGNHSTTHPSDSSLLTREKLAWELLGVHNYLRTNFGYRSLNNVVFIFRYILPTIPSLPEKIFIDPVLQFYW